MTAPIMVALEAVGADGFGCSATTSVFFLVTRPVPFAAAFFLALVV